MKRKLKNKQKKAQKSAKASSGQDQENSASIQGRKDSMQSNQSSNSNNSSESLILNESSNQSKGDQNQKVISSAGVLGKRRATHSTVQQPQQPLPKISSSSLNKRGKKEKGKRGAPRKHDREERVKGERGRPPKHGKFSKERRIAKQRLNSENISGQNIQEDDAYDFQDQNLKSSGNPDDKIQGKQVLKLGGEPNSYQMQQEEHLRNIERERKYKQNKKLRDQKEKVVDEETQFWQEQRGTGQATSTGRKVGRPSKNAEQEVDEEIDSDKDNNAYDMRREDAELEKILRDYNNESRSGKKKQDFVMDRPLDLSYYKGIQLPQHLNWVSIYTKQNESVLMQEIYALDLEIKRLKELKAMHKEFRRYVEMPIGVMSRPCPCCKGWSKKKHYCNHEFCEKPCRKQEEPLGQPKPAKESIIQQQIQNVLMSTLSKIQQKNNLDGGNFIQGTLDPNLLHQQTLNYLNLIGANPSYGGTTNIIFPMVDERNKRGRPPKKPKTLETTGAQANQNQGPITQTITVIGPNSTKVITTTIDPVTGKQIDPPGSTQQGEKNLQYQSIADPTKQENRSSEQRNQEESQIKNIQNEQQELPKEELKIKTEEIINTEQQ
eukprot:403336376